MTFRRLAGSSSHAPTARASASILLLLGVLLVALGCSPAATADENLLVPVSDPLMRWATERHPAAEVLVAAKADVTGDGTEDLVVIMRESDGKNYTRVIIGGETPVETDAVPAPQSNQRVTFRDIDDTPPVEFIIRGSKGADIGYAIYRVEDGAIVDLFGENMDRCCGLQPTSRVSGMGAVTTPLLGLADDVRRGRTT